MSKIGFIGLGMMGNPMARNLAGAGYDLLVYDKRKEATAAVETPGAHAALDLSEMALCDIVFVIVNTGAQVEEVVTGITKGLNENSGITLVVMSTISPNLLKKIHRQVSPKGVKTAGCAGQRGPDSCPNRGTVHHGGGRKGTF